MGGGVVTDVGGFAAAVYHRGTRYVNVATTLLGQVDAAIGGKTGVNLARGQEPRRGLLAARWGALRHRDPRHPATARVAVRPRRDGQVRVLVFGHPDASLLDLDIDEQVARCAGIKAAVVADDETEEGRRMTLNYGHTLAHALEAEGFERPGTELAHGEAVAIGLVFAALLARRLGRIDDERVALHRRVVAGFDLAAELPAGSDPERLVAAMGRDKKAHHDLTFVLDGPRGVEPVAAVAATDVVATLSQMGSDR